MPSFSSHSNQEVLKNNSTVARAGSYLIIASLHAQDSGANQLRLIQCSYAYQEFPR